MFSEEAASRLTRRVPKWWAARFSSAKVGSQVRARKRRGRRGMGRRARRRRRTGRPSE